MWVAPLQASMSVVSCITNSSGLCTITKAGWSRSVTSVSFMVNTVTLGSYAYEQTANHDPDGDSNGTFILIAMPK